MTSTIGRRGFLGSAIAASLLRPFRAFGATPGYPRLMEGPMVGAVTPGSITFWGRASGEYDVVVEYSPDLDFGVTQASAPVRALAAADYTVRVTVADLAPGTRYYYRMLVDGIPDRYRLTPFATHTAPDGPVAFRLAFGSCARHQLDAEQVVFRAIAAAEPDLFFWLGDNIYADSASEWVFAEDYRRQRAIASTLPLMRSVPQLAIWDDHDFGLNNSDNTNPVRDASLAAFRNYWANPGYGLADGPGVYFQYAYGGVDFFMLDGRYYRTPNKDPDSPAKTLLGKRQGEWLREVLRASRAPFKVLASGSGWTTEDGPMGDTWAAFLTERNALFDFIRDERIEGVFLLSGDTHFGEVNAIPWSEHGGYDLYDLVSSPLAQATGSSFLEGEPELRIRKPYFRTVNFGLLDFSWDPEPKVTYTLRDVRGDRVYEPLTLTPAELRNGASTWRAKMDPAELARREAGASPST
ncbi:MAG TPA: alkaline phosphatase D family protein [Nevskiaceae bacterium]|nr:alkaline phosphatase D family protein [Nevskiaceae bacterium]